MYLYVRELSAKTLSKLVSLWNALSFTKTENWFKILSSSSVSTLKTKEKLNGWGASFLISIIWNKNHLFKYCCCFNARLSLKTEIF